ncbi:CaiB/BaiF CoA-transferase family protein [Paraburkholderia metrosideri]|uniref:CaiB/BaiF CoA-transferase family protein n=1 Tax=Paraburkholderia metrosideri TaxID=580937 RepID=A0ABW9E6V4_9BURK
MTLPLQGIKVLDLTRALAGPFCSMILADLGADVIKVEPAPNGDMVRTWGPFAAGISAYYLSCNRNKRGIAVDFRQPAALDLLRDMAGQVDVVVENFKSGTMESMGLGFDTLAAANPRLVYGNITGFGRTGPAAQWPGFDQVAQGYSGLMSVTGMPDAGPTRVGVAIGDMTAGMWTAMGVLAALLSRERTGRGQRVESSLLASLVALLGVQGQRYLSAGEIPEPTGNDHPVIAPYGVFDAKDGPLNLAPGTPDMWIRLCELLDLEAIMSDPRFVTNEQRMQHRKELKIIIDARLRMRTRAEWTCDMIRLGIPAGPINNLQDVFADPQVVHCGLVEEVAHSTIGQLKQVASAIGMGEMTEGSVRMPPPMLGEHTGEVLKEFGFAQAQIDAWQEARVVMLAAKTT